MSRQFKWRQIIDAKCKDCIYDPECGGGTWREQVAQCTVTRCPLWPARTGPEGGPHKDYPTDPQSVTAEWLNRPMDAMRRGDQ